jgi:hypothetical protein
MITDRGLLLFSLICGTAVLWSGALIVAIAAGTDPIHQTVAIGVAALLTVPGVAAGILSNRRGYRTRSPRRPWSLASWVPPHVPHWAAVLAGVVFFGFWLAVVLAFAALDGSPQIQGGLVTSPASERQAGHEQQISLGVLGAFAVGGAFLCAARATDHEH